MFLGGLIRCWYRCRWAGSGSSTGRPRRRAESCMCRPAAGASGKASTSSGSGSGYDYLEFRLRILLMLFKHIWKLWRKNTKQSIKNETLFRTHNLNWSKNPTKVCLFPASRTHRPRIRNKILIYLLFHSCRIGSETNNSWSGSGKSSWSDRIRIHNSDIKYKSNYR